MLRQGESPSPPSPSLPTLAETGDSDLMGLHFLTGSTAAHMPELI
jgi:hypothetical protein